MSREMAIRLIQRLVRAEVTIMKQFNSPSGRITKKAEAEERNSAASIFLGLTGDDPTIMEMNEMVQS